MVYLPAFSWTRVLACASALALSACASDPHNATGTSAPATRAASVNLLNRMSWGVDATAVQQVDQLGWNAYIERQLHPQATVLPAAAQAQIDAMTISQGSLATLVTTMEQRRKDAEVTTVSDDTKKAAQKAYQDEMSRLSREAATRSLLRDLYSNNQLLEQMTWFWVNHFSVHDGKSNLRAMVGDYEENAIRAHALGKFRDLLAATVHHPAMIRYLDNEQNAAKRINENYARELMELHTLGVDGGYSQGDVQELARVLTGVGVNLGPTAPKVSAQRQAQYVRDGLFEFNPDRHDFGDKHLLGHAIKGRGLAEIDEAIDLLSTNPATANFVSRKLAMFFVADTPPPALVARMRATFLATDGDIAATLNTMFTSAEFTDSLGKQFKDPMHYVVSAVRLAYPDKVIMNARPMQYWLSRMGEPLYGRQTPDGYPMTESAWASPGQMATRFEIAKAIGSGNAGLFKTEGPAPVERPAFPLLGNALYFQSLQPMLSPPTRVALDQAASPQEWNVFLLASPELMHR